MKHLRFTLGLLIILACSVHSRPVHAQGASFAISTKNLGFGFVTQGKSVTKAFIITNFDNTLSVHGRIGAPTTSVFKMTGSDTFSIGPQTSDTVYFSFTPADLTAVRDSLMITHDGKTNFVANPQKVVLTGQGLSPNDTSAILLIGGFGSTTLTWKTEIFDSAIRPFAFRNVSDVQTRHLRGTISGLHAPFAFAAGTGPTFDVADSAWDTLSFNFFPTSVGTVRDTVLIASNSLKPNDSVRIFLVGTGIPKSGTIPQAEIGSKQINFLSDSVGTTDQQYTILFNKSDSVPLHVWYGRIPSAPFSYTGTTVAHVLAPAKTDTLRFTFTPTAKGNFSDTLLVLTDALQPDDSMRIVIKGTGLSNGVAQSSSAKGLKLSALTDGRSESVSIRISDAENEKVALKLFDESGIDVATVFAGFATPVEQELQFSTRGLAEGVYFLRLESTHGSTVVKVLVRH